MVHVHGIVSCAGVHRESYWSCQPYNDTVEVLLANSYKELIYPRQARRFRLLNYGAFSKAVVFNLEAEKYYGRNGESLFIWHAEDFCDQSESDNVGETCIYVDVLY